MGKTELALGGRTIERNGAYSLGDLDEAGPIGKCSRVLDRSDELALMGINSSSSGTLLLVLNKLRWVIMDILGLILSKKLESKLVLFRAFEGSSKSSENLCGQEKKALAI